MCSNARSLACLLLNAKADGFGEVQHSARGTDLFRCALTGTDSATVGSAQEPVSCIASAHAGASPRKRAASQQGRSFDTEL
jgi:hypothetical protein